MNWIELLLPDLTPEELDKFLFPLNQTYLEEKMIKPAVAQTLAMIEQQLAQKGVRLDEDRRKYLEAGLHSRILRQYGHEG